MPVGYGLSVGAVGLAEGVPVGAVGNALGPVDGSDDGGVVTVG